MKKTNVFVPILYGKVTTTNLYKCKNLLAKFLTYVNTIMEILNFKMVIFPLLVWLWRLVYQQKRQKKKKKFQGEQVRKY